MRGKVLSFALWGLAVVFVAGAVHVASILMMPWVAPADAYARVSALAPGGTAKLLPNLDADGTGLPFRDAALRTALCRYDLSSGPMRVSATIADGSFAALSLHDRTGVNFYGVTDRAAVGGRVELLLLTAAQRETIETLDGEDEPVRDVRVTAPRPEGFVVLDILPRAGGDAAAERSSRTMTCKVEREP